ncbi:unnamed protein product, partial [Ectocarpus sp. 13 AM-2016]
MSQALLAPTIQTAPPAASVKTTATTTPSPAVDAVSPCGLCIRRREAVCTAISLDTFALKETPQCSDRRCERRSLPAVAGPGGGRRRSRPSAWRTFRKRRRLDFDDQGDQYPSRGPWDGVVQRHVPSGGTAP